MTKTKKRKGFTLTELAIVIAVIAILIAVLVPTFTSLITSANESADEQAVKSMNTALATDEALNGKKTNPSEAMQVLIDAGYNIENYQALDSNNVIYWNSETNRTLLYSTSKNEVIYPSDAASTYTDLVADNLPNYWYTLSKAYSTTKYEGTTTAEFVTALGNLSDGETLQLTSDVTLDSKSDSFTGSDGQSYSVYYYDKNEKNSSDASYVSTEFLTASELETYKTENSLTEYTFYKSNFSQLSAIDGSNVEIDLNGYTFTDSGRVRLENGSSITIRNGTYVETSITGNTSSNIYVTEGSSITLDSVTMTVSGSGIYPQGDSAQVNVINSTITSTGAYCVGTNAASVDHYGVIITLSNSTFTAKNKGSDNDSCVVMLNVEGTLNIDNCVINGERQGVVVRAGTANITETTINCNVSSSNITGSIPTKTNMTYIKDSKAWGSGNEVAMGAVVVGNNQNGAYLADAVVTMSGCTVSYTVDGATNSEYAIALFMIANNVKDSTYYNTSVTVSDCSFTGKVINFSQSSTGFQETDNSGTGKCSCNLYGYTGTVYTTWDSTNSKWTTGSSNN